MDISETLVPASDQLDAIELIGAPRTFTIERVSRGNLEQPVQVHFVDFPRPWRPAKGMRRVLAACWGTDASKWAGRRVTLYFDPDVMFGKDQPGGTRISHLSHIDGPKTIPQLVSRGRSAMFRVEPLADEVPPADQITGAQSKKMHALYNELGITDRAVRMAEVCKFIGRDVASSNELSKDEASRLVDWLEMRTQGDPEPDPA